MKTNNIGVEGNIISLDKKTIKKVGIIGCGSHVYRNIIPALKFVEGHEIISVCDLNKEKAKLFAKKHGISKYYSDYQTMIRENFFDSIIIVVGYDSFTGKPLYPEIAKYILSNGINVWMEKPPSDNSYDLEKLKKIAILNNCFFQTGFKMMFSPSIQKVKNMFSRKNFIFPQSFYITYAVDMPTDIRNLMQPGNRRFLDDIVHVFSQLHYLFGKPKKIKYFKSGEKDGFIYLKYSNNLSGTIHVQGGISIIGPAEYLRIIGKGSFIELFGGIKIKYHNYGDPGAYGKDISYLRKDNTFTEEYSPELRQPLGALSLHSEALFGYISEFIYFFNNQDGNGIAGMQDSIDIIKVYEGLGSEEDIWFILDKSKIRYKKKNNILIKSIHICDNCSKYAYIKDGWTYSC